MSRYPEIEEPGYDASAIFEQDGFIDVLHDPLSPETWDYSGKRTAIRRYRVEWLKRFEIRNWLIGLEAPTEGGIWVQRPRRYPDEDGMWVAKIESVGFGASFPPTDPRNGEIEYEEALLTVTYESFPIDGADEPWRMISFDSSKQRKGLNGFAWTFASGQAFPGMLSVEASKGQVEIEWPRCPELPVGILQANGRVNSVEFRDQAREYSWPAETLRVDRISIKETRNMSNQVNYSIHYSLQYDELNHNKEFNPFNGQLEYVYDPLNNKKYQAIDFNLILPL